MLDSAGKNSFQARSRKSRRSPKSANRLACPFALKWMAAWRSIRSATLCVRVRSCLSPATPSSAKATSGKTRKNYWKRRARQRSLALDFHQLLSLLRGSDGNHGVFIRRAGPHHVGFIGIRVLDLRVAQRLAGRTENHDVRAGDDPMIVCRLAGSVGVRIARALVSG